VNAALRKAARKVLSSTVHPAFVECIQGGIRAAFECDNRAGVPMGTRRNTAERGFVEIADAGGAEGVTGGCVRGDASSFLLCNTP
jgi:hypothetical protein